MKKLIKCVNNIYLPMEDDEQEELLSLWVSASEKTREELLEEYGRDFQD